MILLHTFPTGSRKIWILFFDKIRQKPVSGNRLWLRRQSRSDLPEGAVDHDRLGQPVKADRNKLLPDTDGLHRLPQNGRCSKKQISDHFPSLPPLRIRQPPFPAAVRCFRCAPCGAEFTDQTVRIQRQRAQRKRDAAAQHIVPHGAAPASPARPADMDRTVLAHGTARRQRAPAYAAPHLAGTPVPRRMADMRAAAPGEL